MIPTAFVHSFQSLGAVDGPGIRFVIFLQGCPYHCPYCHNPDSRALSGGTEYTAAALADRVERYKPYFGSEGGVTVSGGEPLMQKEFLAVFFEECHRRGISTCLDTAGIRVDDGVRAVLRYTDWVLCDIKHPDEKVCREQFGVDLADTRAFLAACDSAGCHVRVRHVIVPGMTDSEETVRAVAGIAYSCRNLDRIELLPFKKLCVQKYKALGLPFVLENTPECPSETVAHLLDVIGGGLPGGST